MIPQIKAILCVATLTLSFAAPKVDAAETPGLHRDGLTSLLRARTALTTLSSSTLARVARARSGAPPRALLPWLFPAGRH